MNKLTLQKEMQENPQAQALKQSWTPPSIKKISSHETLNGGTAGDDGNGRFSTS